MSYGSFVYRPPRVVIVWVKRRNKLNVLSPVIPSSLDMTNASGR